MRTILSNLLALGLVLSLSSAADAKDLSADEVVERTNLASYYQGDDGRALVTMTISDKKGSQRTRQFTVLRRDEGDTGDQSFYIYFHKPADVAKMVFIAQKHLKSEDDRWLYMPGLDLVKRIAASDERTSFVGSDWFYEDVSGRSLTADTHELVETSKNYYVLKHTPKKAGSVEFSYYKMWVHRGTFLPTKVEYFNKRGKKYRVMTVDAVKEFQGFKTVTKATMKNLSSGTQTTVSYDKVQYNIDLPAKVFTERYLRRAPLKYLKAK